MISYTPGPRRGPSTHRGPSGSTMRVSAFNIFTTAFHWGRLSFTSWRWFFFFFPFFLANWFLFVHRPPLVLCQWGRMFMTVCHFCSHSGIGTWLNAFCAFRWCRLKPTPISYAAKLHLSERLQKPVQIYVPCFWLALPIFYCHMFVSCRIGKEKHLSTVLAAELFSQGSETRLSQWLRN